jgi:hypothetical protein
MKKGTKTTHIPLAFVLSSPVFKGGWFGPPGAVDSLGVAVDMVDVLLSTDFWWKWEQWAGVGLAWAELKFIANWGFSKNVP